jgi:hypothetical protein
MPVQVRYRHLTTRIATADPLATRGYGFNEEDNF